MTDTLPALAAGTSAPRGATLQPGGVNFSLHARSCDRVELGLFDALEDPEPSAVLVEGRWHRWIDTALASPDDIVDREEAPALAEEACTLQPRPLVVLVVRLSAPPVAGGAHRDH